MLRGAESFAWNVKRAAFNHPFLLSPISIIHIGLIISVKPSYTISNTTEASIIPKQKGLSMYQASPTSSKYPLIAIEITAFLLTVLLGVLFHFVYKWTGNNFLVGLFVPVNESIWEHLKLVFFPILLVSIPEYHEHPDYICIKLRSALLGIFAVIILFYTYSGVLGTVIDWINILIYFLAIAISYFYSYEKLNKKQTSSCNQNFSLLLIFFITIVFMIFTVFPPDLGLFRVP